MKEKDASKLNIIKGFTIEVKWRPGNALSIFRRGECLSGNSMEGQSGRRSEGTEGMG